MAKQFFVPGGGSTSQVTDKEYLIPDTGFFNDAPDSLTVEVLAASLEITPYNLPVTAEAQLGQILITPHDVEGEISVELELASVLITPFAARTSMPCRKFPVPHPKFVGQSQANKRKFPVVV